MPTNEQLDQMILDFVKMEPGCSSWLLGYKMQGIIQNRFGLPLSSQKVSGRARSLARRGLLKREEIPNDLYPSEPTIIWYIPAD